MIIVREQPKTLDINMLFSWFIIYSVIGWAYETAYCLVTNGRYLSRGFLFGPLCPIYGLTIILMIVITTDRVKSILGLFMSCALIATVLEYISSYWMELVFDRRWWNYNDMFLNINGRVCLGATVLFGFSGVLFVRFIHPAIMRFISNKVSDLQLRYVNRTILILLLFDIVVSFKMNML